MQSRKMSPFSIQTNALTSKMFNKILLKFDFVCPHIHGEGAEFAYLGANLLYNMYTYVNEKVQRIQPHLHERKLQVERIFFLPQKSLVLKLK